MVFALLPETLTAMRTLSAHCVTLEIGVYILRVRGFGAIVMRF